MADDLFDDSSLFGAVLELDGNGFRALGKELYEFLELSGEESNWELRENSKTEEKRSVSWYVQDMKPFFSGDELTHDGFFVLCSTFTSMIKRLKMLNETERKSALSAALNPSFPSQCIPFGHTGAGKVLTSKNFSENAHGNETSRRTTTSVQPSCVWSPILNPLRSIIEWTYAANGEINLVWTEKLDAKRETWTFACRPTGKGIVHSVNGTFCTGDTPGLRIRFTLNLGKLFVVDDGYLFTRKDYVLTVLNQHQNVVFAYFATLFAHVSQNVRGALSVLLSDRLAASKRD